MFAVAGVFYVVKLSLTAILRITETEDERKNRLKRENKSKK